MMALLMVVSVTACTAGGALRSTHEDNATPTLPIPRGIPPSANFYADPDSQAAVWLRRHPDDPVASAIRTEIVAHAAARWFGDRTVDVGPAVSRYVASANASQQIPIVVAYAIPHRDCGQYSKGGVATTEAYQQWVSAFAAGIGASRVVVVLEPDALAQLDCLPPSAQSDRLDLLRYAATQLKSRAPNALVYLDIGHSGWLSASVAAQRLLSAGVVDVRGFSMNVSNFQTTADSRSYGRAIAALLLKQGVAKTFVVDTSRNGNGPLGAQWCDPAGRRLGERSAVHQNEEPEMTLWIKNPGVGDGCAAAAGTFVPALAYGLIHGT